ncbi:hypothetical protein [Xenorhabdus hominickii]|nr:hypothetical protein [Xenorhabdus hominickii]
MAENMAVVARNAGSPAVLLMYHGIRYIPMETATEEKNSISKKCYQ